MVELVIPGAPQGKGRPRFTTAGGSVRTYTPGATVAYESSVRLEYIRQCRGMRFEREIPLDVRITAFYPIPKSAGKGKRADMAAHKLRPLKKPDTDNVVKAILDALNGIAYSDDVQVVELHVRKLYSENPRVVVSIAEAIYQGALSEKHE